MLLMEVLGTRIGALQKLSCLGHLAAVQLRDGCLPAPIWSGDVDSLLPIIRTQGTVVQVSMLEVVIPTTALPKKRLVVGRLPNTAVFNDGLMMLNFTTPLKNDYKKS